jgi:predicted ribosomally synthesized peptide with SipW-like signal peptide
MTASADRRGLRTSIRVRAGLAAGLVLGLTAGLTVASWTDAEFSRATFTASSFDIQTSLAGGAYTSATTVSGSVNGIYPGGAASYLTLRVKTAASSVAGTVRLSSAANTTDLLAPALRYRIVQSSASCTSADYGGSPVFVVGSASTYQVVSTALAPTTPIAVAAAGGTEAAYCIELSVIPGSAQATYQGKSATVSWTITGASS